MDFTHAQISLLSDCIADKNIKEKCIRTIKEERIYEEKHPTNKYNIKLMLISYKNNVHTILNNSILTAKIIIWTKIINK